MEERRRQPRHGSRLKLPEAIPSSLRKLFQCSPSGCSYSRSLSRLFADLRTQRRNRDSDYDSAKRPIRASMPSREDWRHRLQGVLRPLSPLENMQRLGRLGAEPSRNKSECSKAGLEVSFITLDLEPGRYRPQRRRTRHLDQLPLVYLSKLPPLKSSTPFPNSPSFPESLTPPLIKRTCNRLRHISDSRPSPCKNPAEVSSLGPWLEDYNS